MRTVFIKLLSVFLILLVLMLLAGCAHLNIGVSTEADSLRIITPEEIDSIFAELSNDVTDKYSAETDQNGLQIVFWLEGGAVWHISRDCNTVKRAEAHNVKSGTVEDALNEGKERACKICGGDAVYTETLNNSTVLSADAEVAVTTSVPDTEKYEKDYSEDGKLIVYWLDNGKVWHVSRYCSSLSRSDPDKIVQGFVEDAIAEGKERVCKNCSD